MEEIEEDGTEDENGGGGLLGALAGALAMAMQAMFMALAALILVLLTLLARALQAVFILARPAALVGCVAAAGYTSVTLFVTVLARYGGDWPAVILALAAVIIAPSAMLVLAGDYAAERRAGPGAWAIMLAVAGVEFLARAGIARAPPVVLALLPVLALTGTMMYFLRDQAEHLAERESQNGREQERNGCTTMDHNNQPDHLHSDPKL